MSIDKLSEITEFSLPIRVYIEDTDAGGIVYYVNYLKYMERARTEFMRLLGFDKPAISDEGLLMVVHSASVNYKSPARLDDLVSVSAEISDCRRSYMVFSQSVWRGDTLLCEGQIKVACVKGSTMKPCALPLEIRDAIASIGLEN